MTSAFLQVLATVHNVESSRLHKPRNILNILSTNTRRTKVVELSTGTHRVADELRRHSLVDGQGGHYSTNLDRNRYGSDNNYLFTVTRYNLECLGLCPCLVDIEIIDTRNSNESQLVTAGDAACMCDSPERAELADVSYFAGSNPRAAPPSPHREMRRVASAGALNGGGGVGGGGGGGVRRVPSSHAMRRNPSAGRLYEYGAHPTHSRGSGGSDLFDALLMAATGDHDVRSHGEPPVTSHHHYQQSRPTPTSNQHPHPHQQQHPQQQQQQQRTPGTGRPWTHASQTDLQDSLQNAVDALRGAAADDEGGGNGAGGGVGGGVGAMGLARLGSGSTRGGRRGGDRGMPRRNSVSMIVENPVLAQTGAGDSLMVGQQYYQAYMAAERDGGSGGGGGVVGGVEGEGEGDTDHGEDQHHTVGGGGGGDAATYRQGLLRQFHKQHSAVNLTRLGAGAAADVLRLKDELHQVREQNKSLEVALEESKSSQKEAEKRAEDAAAACRRAADTIAKLKGALSGAGVGDPTSDDPKEEGDEMLRTTDQEIELLHAELAEVKNVVSKLASEKKELEAKVKAAQGPGLPRGNGMPPPSSSAAAAAAVAAAAAFHSMPYAAMGMLPMFGMPPLNPYGGMNTGGGGGNGGGGGPNGGGSGLPPPAPSPFRPLGSMQKVASMPAMHPGAGGGGLMSPPPLVHPKDRHDHIAALKRKATDSPPAVEGGGESPHPPSVKKPAIDGLTVGAVKDEDGGGAGGGSMPPPAAAVV